MAKTKTCRLCQDHTACRASVIHHIENVHKVTARPWMLDDPLVD